MRYDLERFKKAQTQDYGNALREIRNGRKKSHWMWYVFPQVRGLGSSPTAQKYAIQSRQEAEEYEKDPVLGRRLREITEALLAQKESDPVKIFGFPDVLKLRSCMTLFAAVSGENSVFQKVLDAYYQGEKDERTLALLKHGSR